MRTCAATGMYNVTLGTDWLGQAAKKLCKEAYQMGSEDNISAVVVVLKPFLA